MLRFLLIVDQHRAVRLLEEGQSFSEKLRTLHSPISVKRLQRVVSPMSPVSAAMGILPDDAHGAATAANPIPPV